MNNLRKKVLMMTMAAATLSAIAQQPVDYVNPIIGTNGMGHRHQQDVSQVRMSRTTKMSVTEANNGLVPILVTGTILVGIFLISSIYIMRNCVCVRTQLYPSERSASTGKSVPHPIGPDNRGGAFVL